MMDEGEILRWLRESDPGRLDALWRRADALRREAVGEEVHLRGLIEISSHCVRSCAYCGLRAPRGGLARYRLSAEEVLACCREARDRGYGTVVLQAGEDPGLGAAWVGGLVRRIKGEFDLAVALSLGERSREELAAWREAGADRYLLRFETSDADLFRRIHPGLPGRPCDRIALLRLIKELGYETGSGVLVGLPGQTYASLARDIQLFGELDLDMIGAGPFIPHPDTPLGASSAEGEDAVPASVVAACKVIALARLVCPDANIPSTTALAALGGARGRESGLRCGANVVMPNLTPRARRAAYEIYPGKSCPAEASRGALEDRIRALGRRIGRGPGGRIQKSKEERWLKSC